MREGETRRHRLFQACSSLGLVVALALAGCGGPSEHTASGTTLAPGADAHITADTDSSSDVTRVTVKVNHLPPPDRIQAGGKHFVVWQRPGEGTPWQRLGVLQYDSDHRTGQLKEVTVPHRSFEVLVTIESDPNPKEPSTAVVVGPTKVD